MMDDAEHADTTLEEAPVDDTTTDGTEAMADDPAASAVATEAVAEAAAEAEPEALAEELRAAIEAILMVAERPVEPRLLAQLIETSVDGVETACQQLAAAYEEAGRGFILARVAGGWRFQSHPDQAAYVERFVLEGQTTRLSAAALETLAIVAYKQPISRAQVASIRGVSVDAVVRTLSQRGYIDEVSRDPGPGQAVLYGTTPFFLEKLGLNSIADLPELGDFVPAPEVVEALEHGLRFEADEPVVATDAEADADAEAVTDAEAEVDGEDTAAEVAVAEDPTAETDVAEAVLEEAAAVIDQADDGVVIDLRDGADQPIAPEQ